MTARTLGLVILISGTLTACGGSSSLSAAADETSGSNDTAPDSYDPTPLRPGVDYTQLADLSGYDNWVCDNETILDPDTGTVLHPDVEVMDDAGALQRWVTSNSISDHRVGDFPNVGNPNAIDQYLVNYDVAMRVETEQPDRTSANDAQLVAISVGGILLDPFTAEVYNNDRSSGWNYEALTIGAAANADLAGAIGYLGTDCNNAHVQPNGKYHYHGMPEELVSNLLESKGGHGASSS